MKFFLKLTILTKPQSGRGLHRSPKLLPLRKKNLSHLFFRILSGQLLWISNWIIGLSIKIGKSHFPEELIYLICQNILGRWRGGKRKAKQKNWLCVKSLGGLPPCRFKSDPRYQTQRGLSLVGITPFPFRRRLFQSYIFLTDYSLFCILNLPQNNFLLLCALYARE